MSATIPIPFGIGEQLWWVGHGSREVRKTCPECAGQRVLTIILGTGEQVNVDCETCKEGYQGPFGTIRMVVHEHTPTPFTPQRVNVDGNRITYSESPPDAACYSCVYAEDLFRDRDECQRRCDELSAEHAESERRRILANITCGRRRASHGVGYWRCRIKDLEEQLAVARNRLSRCKTATPPGDETCSASS